MQRSLDGPAERGCLVIRRLSFLAKLIPWDPRHRKRHIKPLSSWESQPQVAPNRQHVWGASHRPQLTRGRDPTDPAEGRTPLRDPGVVRQEAFPEEVSFLGTEGLTRPAGQTGRWELGTVWLVTDLHGSGGQVSPADEGKGPLALSSENWVLPPMSQAGEHPDEVREHEVSAASEGSEGPRPR